MRLDVLNPRVLPYALTLCFLGAGAVVGLVVSTGSLVKISLVIGGIAGLLLLNALPVAVWLLLVGVLLVSGPVAYFFPALSRIAWLFSLLGVFMSGAAMIYAVAGKEAPARRIPGFVYLALGLAVLAAVGAAFSNGSVDEISSGAKRQFQFWGLIFLFAVVPFQARTVKRWLIFLLGVAVIQLPFALYQRVVLVPQVMGFEQAGFVPFDIIVGSFEGSITGGGASAIMAMFQVLACLGLYCAYREKLLGGIATLLLAIPVLLPLGLGETKVVMILIPVVLLAAFYDTIAKRPLAFAGGVLATIVVGGFLAYLYFLVQVSGEMSLEENLAQTFAYNFGDQGYYGGRGLNRMTAVPYWFQSQSWAEPMRALFGYGVGSAYGMDGRVALLGHMFTAHAGMYIDLVAASQLLWELGAVGALLFFGTLFGAARSAMKSLSQAVSAWDKVLCRVLLASLSAALLMAFYSSSMLVLVTHSLLLALTLGLVAWRARHGPLEPTAADRSRAAAGASIKSGRTLKGRKFKHWSAPGAPGYAGAFQQSPATATGAGFPARAAAAGRFDHDPQAWHSPAAPRPSSPAGRASAQSAVSEVEPMFATEDEPDDHASAVRASASSDRAGRRGSARIDPVIDAFKRTRD